jgi:DNA-directed RNA polymerase specialized sigma24 family protein
MVGIEMLFEHVHETFRQKVSAVLGASAISAEGRERMSQEIWLRVNQLIESERWPEDQGHQHSLLLRIVTDKIALYHRELARKRAQAKTWTLASDIKDFNIEQVAGCKDTSDADLAKEVVDELIETALTKERREVVKLRLSGMGFREIAASLNISPNAAMIRYHKALAAMRQALVAC